MSALTLVCAGCGRSGTWPRLVDPTVPTAVVRVETETCARCSRGAPLTETWFDERGREVAQ